MYCSKCGNRVEEGDFCNKCGNRINGSGIQQQQSNMDSYNPYQKTTKPHYAPGSFVECLHSFGKSILFLIGISLFSAGNIFNIFTSFNIWSVFYLIYLALPITGFWLIFAASYTPNLPEKTLPALTLFKATIITNLVINCFSALGFFVGSIFLFYLSSEYGNGGLAGIGFLLLLIAGGIVAYHVIYFKLTMNIIEGIRHGINRNSFGMIPNIKIFSILTYIGVGITVFSSLSIAASSRYIFNNLLYYIPGEFRSLLGGFLSLSPLSMFFTLMACAGTVICIIVLNQFKNYTETKTCT